MFGESLGPVEKAVGTAWEPFFSQLRNAAVGYGCEEPKRFPDREPFRMDFSTFAGNRFSAYLHRDELGGAFARILGLVKYLESDEEAVYFLMKNGNPGIKIFLDNRYFGEDYWQAVLSFDHPLGEGIPSEPWFTRILTWLDHTLHDLKQEFQVA